MTEVPGVGVDIHAAFYQVSVISQDGEVSDNRIETGTEGENEIVSRINAMPLPPIVAMEACTGAYHLHAVLQRTKATVLIIDPRKMRERFPKRGKKTDKIDARNLAHLARFQDTKSNWIPSEETRRLRELTSERCRITQQCTTEMNRIHAKLKEYGYKWPGASKALWSEKGRAWLNKQMAQAPKYVQYTVCTTLERIDLLWRQRMSVEATICEETQSSQSAKLLLTLPGVSAVGAAVILAEVGDWRRFENAKQLVSYAGLNPSVSQSGLTCSHGPISKEGRNKLRWICVELGLTARKHCPRLGAFHNRIKKRTRCHGKAKVATGRKLLTLCWHILRSGNPYSHERADLTERKNTRIMKLVRNIRTKEAKAACG